MEYKRAVPVHFGIWVWNVEMDIDYKTRTAKPSKKKRKQDVYQLLDAFASR